MRWQALAEAAEQMIEDVGDRVARRMSSTKALEAFWAQPDKFDLVIPDQTMLLMTNSSMKTCFIIWSVE